MSDHTAIFKKLVSEAGIPTSEAEIADEWQKINQDEGTLITNDSDYSPFWRLLNSIVTRAALWFVDFIPDQLLPASFTKTARGDTLDLHAWDVGLDRKPANKAKGLITFTRESASNGMVVPVGTRVQSVPINEKVYELITTATAEFGYDSLTAVAKVEALEAGSAFNLASGYYSVLPEPVNGVASVTNDKEWLTTPGDDGETDDELRLRARNQFLAVNQYHTDAVYRTVIAQFGGIRTDYIYFEHDAPRGPGTGNAFVLFEADAPTDEFINSINQHIRDKGYHGHGDDLMCYAMPETLHDITLTLKLKANLTSDETSAIKKGVEDMVRCAFRQNTDYDDVVTKVWPQSVFSLSVLTREMHNRFVEIETLSFSNGDIVNAMDVARLNTLTITE